MVVGMRHVGRESIPHKRLALLHWLWVMQSCQLAHLNSPKADTTLRCVSPSLVAVHKRGGASYCYCQYCIDVPLIRAA